MDIASILTLGAYTRWQQEARTITQSLGLVYREQSSIPLPPGVIYGDPLPASNNAITHAYISAKITQTFGADTAKRFGDWRETNQPPGAGNDWDTYKDLWNNEVGRRIGAAAGFFDDAAIINLIKDAMRNGDLIIVQTDGRIPNGYTYSADEVKNFQIKSVITHLPLNPIPQCFLAGTPILMADGTEKPIENIQPGDVVGAFDQKDQEGLGPVKARKVTRIFRNVAKTIINLRGLKMTPGHVVLTDRGEWSKIAEVLLHDRAIVEQRGDKPVLVRARTGVEIGSLDDIPIKVVFNDPATGQQRVALVRAGIPALAEQIDRKTARAVSMARVLTMQGYTIAPDGTITGKDGKSFHATPWPGGGTPYDRDIKDIWVLAVDGAPYVPQWILDLPVEDEEVGQMVVNAPAQGMNGPGRAYSASTGRAVSGSTYGARPLNRAAWRRQAALRLVT